VGLVYRYTGKTHVNRSPPPRCAKKSTTAFPVRVQRSSCSHGHRVVNFGVARPQVSIVISRLTRAKACVRNILYTSICYMRPTVMSYVFVSENESGQ